MAIQLPNPGLGDGQTGDNEFVMWTKVKDNFTNASHAASKLVGTSSGNLVTAENIHYAWANHAESNAATLEIVDNAALGTTYTNTLTGSGIRGTVRTFKANATTTSIKHQTVIGYGAQGHRFAIRFMNSSGNNSEWAEFYSNKNTTKEDGTGYLVASSPVLKVQHDSFEKVHEAEQLDIEVNNIETGVYEITGTTGLREGDGWNLKPPKDVNGNVLCICEASEKDGIITLKTYKKKFDFETVSIVADYEQPTDIPEGATVMLRFNDLPQEQLDEPIE